MAQMAENEKAFFRDVEQTAREADTTRALDNAQRIGAISTSLGGSILTEPPAQYQIRFPVTTVTMRQNTIFTGRDPDIATIHQILDPSQRSPSLSPLCVVVHGLGGQGKSQLALEYSYRHRQSYDGIFWLSSETENALEVSFAEIARKVRRAENGGREGRTTSPEGELASDIEYARDWLEGTNRRWLLLFDNLEDADLVDKFFPVNLAGHGSIIVTTQKAHMSQLTNDFKKIPLSPLTSDSGSNLLFKVLERAPKGNLEEITTHEISTWVGGLPLALVTLGGYMKVSESSPTELFESLKRSSNSWVSSGEGSIRNYDKTLATVFDIALGELSENARHLVDILAYLNPDHVSEELLTFPHSLPTLNFLNDKDEFLDMRRDLGLRQLVRRETLPAGSHLAIHRSLQMNILHGLKNDKDPEKRQRIFQEVFSIIEAVLPEPSQLAQNKKDTWPKYRLYVPQVISLRQNSQWPDPPLVLNFQFARMLANTGTYLWHTGRYKDCDATMTMAETIMRAQDARFQSTPEWEELLSDIYLVIDILADCIGVSKRKQSLDHRQELMRLRQKELDAISVDNRTTDDLLRWAKAKADLACAYMQRGRYSEAKEIMDELLVWFGKWTSEVELPYEYSKYYSYSAYILMAEGKVDESIESARKGLILETTHAGGEDETVLSNQYCLSSLLFNAGKVDEALALHMDTLQKRIELCGEDSQLTLESYEAVGIILHLQGRDTEAEHHFKKCLANRSRANWTFEGIARAQFWHSKVLEKIGNPEAAEKELKAARAVKQQYLELYQEFLVDDADNEAAVFDQMLPMWSMATTGPLARGGANRNVVN
ncbi:hypothetical protein DL98DRAFT_489524 [Cadophora sp. DSE1049]|nr:hypothetical protein DL98DRAFT_489524 [Cadophora sp. DSE1049]